MPGQNDEDNESKSNGISYKQLVILATVIGTLSGTIGTQLGRTDPWTGENARLQETDILRQVDERLKFIDKRLDILDRLNENYREHKERPHAGVTTALEKISARVREIERALWRRHNGDE